MTPRRLFALDQNFPEPVLAALESVLPAELVPVRKIDPKLSEVADWELLLALHRHSRPWDGLITNDDAMLKLPKELVVLSQTRLTLVVAKGEGHNPIRAVGALLCHLSHIRHQTNPQAAQIWTLRVAQKPTRRCRRCVPRSHRQDTRNDSSESHRREPCSGCGSSETKPPMTDTSGRPRLRESDRAFWLVLSPLS
jgi:hypothetical protein